MKLNKIKLTFSAFERLRIHVLEKRLFFIINLTLDEFVNGYSDEKL